MPTQRMLANAIRALSMDAVEQAASGHPGMPMGMADIAEVLWRRHLRHNPNDPSWPNRDRFVVSNGHGSMLLYSALYLSGYPLSLDDLRAFRQLHSKTPGHPERDPEIGIETTTGPLGQGLANAVGMALAEKLLAQRYNRPDYPVIDHHTYVFAGDGCLMEGVSHEACSLAGTLELGKLIVFYDDNGISIDGSTQGWFTDDTPGRFRAYGWQVLPEVDGHDAEAVDAAIETAKADSRPSLICCRTVIGYGAPNKQGTADTHGAPLGADEIQQAREALQWPHPPFEIPQDILDAWDARTRGAQRAEQWQDLMEAYAADHPQDAQELMRRLNGRLPEAFSRAVDKHIQSQLKEPARAATRKHSGNTLDAIAESLPELLGGSADLTGSNNTQPKGSSTITAQEPGNYLYYGVREFGMGAIMNGLALHGGVIPYGGTFLTFSDYARNAVRMAALMRLHVIFVLTHDSVGLGEDGPTHQPIEHLDSLRLIPDLEVWRPADAIEAAVAWKCALQNQQQPSAMVLSRQTVEVLQHSTQTVALIARGGYVLQDCDGTPDLILMSTGSELGLAVQCAQALADHNVRVVSVPCMERFARQELAYIEEVLPPEVRIRIAVEAGTGVCWQRWLGEQGRLLGITEFGHSAPGACVMEHFGMTADNLTRMARELLGREQAHT